jgi:single-strand DNA-binding protein
MEIVGRLTADAKVSTLKDNRQVVNFTVAINDSYKPKNSEAAVKITNYVNCSYWISTSLAQSMNKGTLVELSGRIGVTAWVNAEGEPKAALNFHVNRIKLHGKSSPDGKQTASDPIQVTEALEDLPF